ncbi:hypothetical protein BCD49_12685 [Pseudofrankia sp. EUN1h]|nr:hypothetical protein BCD49_12685 [Pseudofrankia sp. EUN1h]
MVDFGDATIAHAPDSPDESWPTMVSLNTTVDHAPDLPPGSAAVIDHDPDFGVLWVTSTVRAFRGPCVRSV